MFQRSPKIFAKLVAGLKQTLPRSEDCLTEVYFLEGKVEMIHLFTGETEVNLTTDTYFKEVL